MSLLNIQNNQNNLRIEYYKKQFICHVRIMFDVFYNLRILDKFESNQIIELLYVAEKVDLNYEAKYNHYMMESFIDFLRINNYSIKCGQRHLENLWTTLNKNPNELHNTIETFINVLNTNEKRVLNVFMIHALSLIEEIDEALVSTCDEM
jgi:hypothetical protein